MAEVDDAEKTVLRNMLLGRWAAEKLGLPRDATEAYCNDLASRAFDPAHGDVHTKIREDFDSAGVNQSDEQILNVMTELMIKAGNLMPSKKGSSTPPRCISNATSRRVEVIPIAGDRLPARPRHDDARHVRRRDEQLRPGA
jgi:hypothetical protein